MTSRSPRTAGLVGALAAAVIVPSLTRGGYTAASRAVFAGLAGAALIVLVAWFEAPARRLARSAVVAILAALALVALVSVAWSIDRVGSLRWALVLVGYAVVALAAGVVAERRRGAEALATIAAVLAAVAAVLGLVAWALHERPYADLVYGRWRPGGPFEYPPALALVAVCGLPALLVAMTRARAWLSVTAASAATVAVGALVLSASRWQLLLGAAVLALPLLAPARTLRVDRAAALAAVGTVAAAAVGVFVLSRYPAARRYERLLDVGLICGAATAAWALLRGRVARWSGGESRAGRWLAAAGVVAIAVLATLWIATLSGRFDSEGGFTHSRTDQWQAAAETALDRPLSGFGADTYGRASRSHQKVRARSRYAHNLPLEAWAELGLPGFALILALHAFAARALWRARGSPAAWLLGPAAVAFLLTNLLDWPWHLVGVGALWALAVGGLVGSASAPPGPTRTAP